MKVVIDDKSGFCFGVVRAIEAAQNALQEGITACLGDIVHNSLEVNRLKEIGLHTILHDQLKDHKRVLIRAHGEPPLTYDIAKKFGVELIDATCPVVAMLQKRVKQAWGQMEPIGGQVVILGKKGHAEVVGLEGQIEGHAIVVETEEDLKGVNFNRPLVILSQTTQSLELFYKIKELVEQNAKSDVFVHDTICRQVAGRAPHLKEFATKYDVVIFVCGKKSSNGKALYEVCKTANVKTYQIEKPEDIDSQWFEGVDSVGVCGATSTPLWQMENVAKMIKSFKNEN